MRKLLSFFLILHVGAMAHGVDTRPERPLVTRYPAWLDNVMYKISTCKEVEDMAEQYRGNLEQVPENRYTKLFQDAQRTVGIKESDILPIKICNDTSDKTKDFAVTSPNEIRVISDNMDKQFYGVKRQAALHEALHHKYNDQTKHHWMLEKIALAWVTASYLTTISLWAKNYTNKRDRFRIKKAIVTPFAVSLLGLMAVYPIIKFAISHDYYEFRADRDATELLKCYKCTNDLHSIISPRYSGRYLTSSEVQVYCDYYKKQNMLCSHHSAEAEHIEN